MTGRRWYSRWLPTAFLMATLLSPAQAQEKKEKEVGGQADVLRHTKKKFVLLEKIEDDGSVRLLTEGKSQSETWQFQADSEIRVDGWWARLDDLIEGDRYWVWLAVDRARKPTGILMLADEPSEQDIHGHPYTIKERQEGEVVLHIPESKRVKPWTLSTGGKDWPSLKVGAVGYVKSRQGTLLQFEPKDLFEKRRAAAKERLRGHWREQGLPGVTSFLHPLSGEMEVFLDHESMHWSRYLKKGDLVELNHGETRTKAQVRSVEPWRERTRIGLVSSTGFDQVSLTIGDRIHVVVPEPPAEVLSSTYPSDIGRLKDRGARIEWFLASIYCPCGSSPDRCTGMFYTLASCNVNVCEMPNDMRRILGRLIDEGLDDKAVWDRLGKETHPDVYRQHLLR